MEVNNYGLPHDEMRPRQAETIEELMAVDRGKNVVVEAATGFGKTALPAAISTQHIVTVLCRTKMLQVENYAGSYSFDAMFGKGNYVCVYNPELRADACEFSDKGMHKCPKAGECEYLLQKSIVKKSSRRSLNYAYWLSARNWRDEVQTDYLFLDEAHLLSDITLDWSGCTITQADVSEWDLPALPEVRSCRNSMMFADNGVDKALAWLEPARETMRAHYKSLEKQAKTGGAEAKRRFGKCERLGIKFGTTISALQSDSKDWFVLSGASARRIGAKQVSGFIARPLTARQHFGRYFLNGWTAVMMSATIGDVDVFTKELGVTGASSVIIPSNWPPETRPILIPAGAPAIGYASASKDEGAAYEKQADLIVNLLRSVPPAWSGVIHVSSKAQARALAGRLAARHFDCRIWIPPDGGTDAQMAAWSFAKQRIPGALAITYSWHEGVDLTDERICIVAKIPFPSLADPYEKERLDYSHDFYSLRTAWALQQACGRTRRGERDDYDTDGQRRGLVAIVDGNWKRIKKYLSQDFVDSIVEV